MKICVVNFAKGDWYPQGTQRMKASFINNGYKGDFLFFTGEQQLSCPTHQKVPYAFKPCAIMEAYKKGYELVIWVDSSITLLKPFSEVLDFILKNKYMLLKNGWTSGEWCADTALAPLGITREESFTYPHIMACLMCFDFREEINVRFLKEYYERGMDGITFKGAWKNDEQQVSKNKRVLGHRHDQTAASIIAHRLGMKFTEYLLTYEPDSSKWQNAFLFLNRGGPDE